MCRMFVCSYVCVICDMCFLVAFNVLCFYMYYVVFLCCLLLLYGCSYICLYVFMCLMCGSYLLLLVFKLLYVVISVSYLFYLFNCLV